MGDVEYPPNCSPILISSNNGELVKRLKTLSEALQNADGNEDVGQPNRYQSLVEHITAPRFLQNSNREVNIWLACCIADILRVFSPNVPIGDPSHLRDVLIFLISSLKGLDSPSNPLFRRHFYLLENMGATNTLQLCLELPSDDSSMVIRHFVKTSLEIVKGKEWLAELQLGGDSANENDDSGSDSDEKSERKEKMLSILKNIISKLLQEVDQIEVVVLDPLFFYLINPQKSNYVESYKFAKTIVRHSYTALDAPVQSLLTKSLMTGGLPEECELTGTTKSKLYDVVVELYDVVPELVSSVVPNIGSCLTSEDENERLIATKAMGAMVKNPKSHIHDEYPDVWKHFLRRFGDRATAIRLECVRNAGRILVNHSQLRGPICEALCRLVCDTDIEVRLLAIQISIDAAKLKLDAVNEDLILACCARVLDKKINIRKEAITRLIGLYSKVIQGEEYTVSDRQVVSIIPRKILAIYLKDTMKAEQVMLERSLNGMIIPFKLDTKKRVTCMIDLFMSLSVTEMDAFMRIVLRNAAYRRIMREILDIISREKDENKGKEIAGKIHNLSQAQTDPAAFTDAMKAFTNLLSTEQRAFEHVRLLVSSEYTHQEVLKAGPELNHLVGASKSISKDVHTHIRHFVERFSPMILDNAAAAELVRCVFRIQADVDCGRSDARPRLEKTLHLLKIWAEGYPHLFSGIEAVETLLKMIQCDNSKTVERGLEVLDFVCSQTSLKAKEQPWYNDVVSESFSLVTSTLPDFHRVAKLAVKLSCRLRPKSQLFGPDGIMVQLAPILVSRLDIENPACSNALRALTIMYVCSPDDLRDTIAGFAPEILVSKLILNPISDPDDEQNLDPRRPLAAQPKPKYTMNKVYAMKMLCRFLMGHVDQDVLVGRTFNLLSACISSGGDLHHPSVASTNISPIEKAFMRATAGSCMLHLCYIQKYAKMLGASRLLLLGELMKDPEDCIREYFIMRLNKGLVRNKLLTEFFSLFACAPLLRPTDESEEAIIKRYHEKCHVFMVASTKRRAQTIMHNTFQAGLLPYIQVEYSIAYAIYILASQSSFVSHKDVETLAQLQECIWFMIEPLLVNKALFDFDLIYRAVDQLKICTMASCEDLDDDEVDEMNKKMWALADLVMVMLVYRAKVITRSDPGNVVLSKAFFQATKKTTNIVYAPEELLEDERKRNGRLPTEKRKATNMTTLAGSSRGGRSRGRAKGNTTTSRGRKAPVVEEVESESEIESIASDESAPEVIPTPKRRSTGASTSSAPDSSQKETRSRGQRKRNVSVESLDDDDDISAPPAKQTRSPVGRKNGSRSNGHPVEEIDSDSTKRLGKESANTRKPTAKNVSLLAGTSLKDLTISPIVKDPSMAKGRRGATGLASSTPIVQSAPARRSSKRNAGTPLLEENEEVEQSSDDEPIIESKSIEKDTKQKGKPAARSVAAKIVPDRTRRGANKRAASPEPTPASTSSPTKSVKSSPVKTPPPVKRASRSSASTTINKPTTEKLTKIDDGSKSSPAKPSSPKKAAVVPPPKPTARTSSRSKPAPKAEVKPTRQPSSRNSKKK